MYLKLPLRFTNILNGGPMVLIDEKSSIDQHLKLILAVVPGELTCDLSYGGKIKLFNLQQDEIHAAKQGYLKRLTSILNSYENRLKGVEVTYDNQESELVITGQLPDGSPYNFIAPIKFQ